MNKKASKQPRNDDHKAMNITNLSSGQDLAYQVGAEIVTFDAEYDKVLFSVQSQATQLAEDTSCEGRVIHASKCKF